MQKRVVTIQDISCFGKCSLTVALPLISAVGIECAIIPTSILSTHTAGFKEFTFHSLTDQIKPIINHWQQVGLTFDSIYTGYLGTVNDIDQVISFLEIFKNNNNIYLLDPVMGDNGTIYPCFDQQYVEANRRLCQYADIIVPNITEAMLLLGEEYQEYYNDTQIVGILKKLHQLGSKKIVLTGIKNCNDELGIAIYDATTETYQYYFQKIVPVYFHGTGDIFASSLISALMAGHCLYDAAVIAVNFVITCIKETIPNADQHWYGVMFEKCLPQLIEAINKKKME